jgi:hypothetical protein
MHVLNTIALCIGYVVMAVGGIGLAGAIVYFAANEYFRFAVNRIGGFNVLKRYLANELKFLYWLHNEHKEDTPDAAR